ncbi:hypothetical protein K6W78_07720 [Burkholderia cepacia]|uniref:hypothetical protein n=1 Tax=Burkholderia cepacia TaxID=292 RepID=UPI001C9663C9|nr:hypothetical protein [Burkholderia cepacia]MBY4799889.1 hypothetical protein [Burkholderia cepacia]
MADSSTNIDQISSTQANKELTMNALVDAASPAMLWGRHASASFGLTWGYYGGRFVDNTGTAHAIANGSITLSASTTTYIFADNVTGAVSSNTTGFPAGKVPLYSVVTGASSVTSWLDYRSYQPSATAGSGAGTVTSVGLSMPSGFSVANSPVTGSGTLAVSLANQSAGVALIGPPSGSPAAPTWRSLLGTDVPVFGASGSSHAPGAVPDPGATVGATRFLREDGTWVTPPGGGGGGGTVTDIAASGGIETTNPSNADITSAGGLRSNLIPIIATSTHTFAAADRGTAILTNSSGAVTQTLPTPTGTSGNYPSGWWCEMGSIGTGATTLAIPTGLTLDGVTNGTFALTQFTCVKVFTDGTNWFSARGLGSGGGTSKDAHGYYLANNPTVSAFTLAQSTSLSGNATMSNLSSGRGFNIVVPCQSAADNNAFAYQAVPSGSSWAMTAMLVPMVVPGNASNFSFGVQDSTGKLVLFGFEGYTSKITYSSWTNINTFSGRTTYMAAPMPIGVPIWFKLTYTSGGNFVFYTSSEGETFVQQFAISVTNFIGTPANCGIWLNHNLAAVNTTTKISMSVMSYVQG